MGDFLGSYFLDTDEAQLGQNSALQGEKQSVPVVHFEDIDATEKTEHKNQTKEGDEKFGIENAYDDEDFLPVAIKSMSMMDPQTMHDIFLTRKGEHHFDVSGMTAKEEGHVQNASGRTTGRSAEHGKEVVEVSTSVSDVSLLKRVFSRFRSIKQQCNGTESRM